MKTLVGAIALILGAPLAAQTAPVGNPDAGRSQPQQHQQHSQHQLHGPQSQHAEHKREHRCCTHVNGKMECHMMKGHGSHDGGQDGQRQGHSGH